MLVHVSRLAPSKSLHQKPNRLTILTRIQYQVNVIGHKTPGVHLDTECGFPLLQGLQIVLIVERLDKYCVPIMPSRHHMVRQVRNDRSRLPWHREYLRFQSYLPFGLFAEMPCVNSVVEFDYE